ncbi:hypothetical protein U1Q18_051004 [Sarracenia purpurea var. burkii]
METKEDRQRCYDNYSISTKPRIPDMLTVYREKETDDLKMNAPSLISSLTGLRRTKNTYILNNANSGKESPNTECASSHPSSRKLLFDKYSQIPTIPYPRCNLSGNDCIKSDDIDTYTVSDDDRRNTKVFDKYPDSFDSDSSCIGISDEDSCSDKLHNVDRSVVDVVEKVINNYHNLLRNFYDPTITISRPDTSHGVEEVTKIFNEIILEPPDMFSDSVNESSDVESTFEYLSYVNPPTSLNEKHISDSESSYSIVSSAQSTDKYF